MTWTEYSTLCKLNRKGDIFGTPVKCNQEALAYLQDIDYAQSYNITRLGRHEMHEYRKLIIDRTLAIVAFVISIISIILTLISLIPK